MANATQTAYEPIAEGVFGGNGEPHEATALGASAAPDAPDRAAPDDLRAAPGDNPRAVSQASPGPIPDAETPSPPPAAASLGGDGQQPGPDAPAERARPGGPTQPTEAGWAPAAPAAEEALWALEAGEGPGDGGPETSLGRAPTGEPQEAGEAGPAGAAGAAAAAEAGEDAEAGDLPPHPAAEGFWTPAAARAFGALCEALEAAGEDAAIRAAAARPQAARPSANKRLRYLTEATVARLMLTERRRLPSEHALGAFAGATLADAKLADEAARSAAARLIPWAAIARAAQEEGYPHPVERLATLFRQTGSLFPRRHWQALERGSATPWEEVGPAWERRQAAALFAGLDFSGRDEAQWAACDAQARAARDRGLGWGAIHAAAQKAGYPASRSALATGVLRMGTIFGAAWRQATFSQADAIRRSPEPGAAGPAAAPWPKAPPGPAPRRPKASSSPKTRAGLRPASVDELAKRFEGLGFETMTDEEMARGWGSAATLGEIAAAAIAQGARVVELRAAATLAGFTGSASDFQHLITNARRRGEVSRRRELVAAALASAAAAERQRAKTAPAGQEPAPPAGAAGTAGATGSIIHRLSAAPPRNPQRPGQSQGQGAARSHLGGQGAAGERGAPPTQGGGGDRAPGAPGRGFSLEQARWLANQPSAPPTSR